MKRAWPVVGVCLAFVPMLLVGLLLLAIKWARMDAITRQMPDSVRTTVAAAVMQNAGWGPKAVPKFQRVLGLDPDNPAAWERLCWAKVNGDSPKEALPSCERAVGLNGDAGSYYSLGKAQEANLDECAAADSYLKSSQKNSTGQGYIYMQGLGRASLRCGKDPYMAQAGLQGAIDLATKDLTDSSDDDDGVDDEKADLALDRKYFAIVESELKDPKGEAAACAAVDAGWKRCSCKLDEKGKPECSGS